MKYVHIVIIVALGTVSCGLSQDDRIELYKCEKSAMYLERNEDLMRKATSWKLGTLPQNIESREDFMKFISKTNTVMSEVMNEDGSFDKSNLLDWYNSDYCESVLKEYQDYEFGAEEEREAAIIEKNKDEEKALLRQVLHYSKSMVSNNTKEASCDKFKEQFDITYNNTSTSKYKNDLQIGLRSTIKESSFKLKKFQIDYVESQIADDHLEEFSREIYEACPNEQLLSDQIGLVRSVEYSESPRSKIIKEKLSQVENDNKCGDLPEVFCLAELRRTALENAVETSKKCDWEDNIGEQCSLNAEDMYTKELTKAEITKLNEEKLKYERYIENPYKSELFNSSNAATMIDDLAEKCKRAAVDSGLRGESYYKQVEEVCTPNAKIEFLSPQAEVLKRIVHRLEEINKESSHAEKSIQSSTDQSISVSDKAKLIELDIPYGESTKQAINPSPNTIVINDK